MKVITLITRRPDLTRSQFRDYYEQHHAPLGARHFPFDKYVRNHLIASTPGDVGFDCLMECWIDRARALKSLDGPMGELFAEDEAKFMVTRGIGVDVVEHLIAGSPRGVDPRGIAKTAILLSKAADRGRPEFLATAREWARSLGQHCEAGRVTLDEVLPGHQSPIFSADAVVTLWGAADITDLTTPPGLAVQAIMAMESEETTPAELAENFGS